MSEHSQWKRMSLGLVLTMFCWAPARAQQEPVAALDGQNPPVLASGSEPGQTTSPQPADSSTNVPSQAQIRPAGRSSPLLSYSSFLRWGPIYVRTMEFLQGYDQIDAAAGSNQGIFNQRSFTSTVLRTDIIYDRQFKQSRLELQYSPRLTIVNGNVGSNYANQNANMNWVRQLSPRWTLAVNPSVTYMKVRQMYGDFFLDANAITGTNVPSSFLDGAGSWLTTTTQVTVAYALSPTSSVSLTPFFGYSHVGGQVNAAQPFSIYQYGGIVRWDKRLSPTKGVNANYYSRIVGDLGNGTLYQSGEIGYDQQFGPSTTVGVSAGLLTGGFASRQWNLSGSVQLSRKFGRSIGTVGYYRGFPLFAETASQGIAQRVDGTYRVDLSQKWYLQVQGGYENSLWSTAKSFSGKYVAAEAGYNLTPGWACLVTYARKIQSGTDSQLLAGTRNFYLLGLRWSARPVQ
jgi:hypothetical protein